jgi:multidrug resistance protein
VKDKQLWILAFVCVINSIGFGIIIPLLYSYGKEFGVTQQTIGWLTASFSIAQFFATPVLGSLSDKFGRRPLLAISLVGTCISFIIFSQAQSILVLFIARILDGLTGGNISVAQAIITDTSTPADRAKKFGILGSAFGFGFVLGPAIGGLLSNWSMQAPFYFAAAIALLGALSSWFLLKETHPKEKRSKEKNNNKFSFKSLITVMKMPAIGTAIFIGFILTMAQFTMIIGFQTFSVDVLKLTPTNIGWFYAGFGVTGIIMQLAVPVITKAISSRTVILMISTLLCLGAMIASGFTNMFLPFAICIFIYGLFNGLRNPMLNAIIADHNDPEKQGEVMGINQAYISIGQTLGPITAGLITVVSVHYVFYLSALYILIAFLFSFRLKAKE